MFRFVIRRALLAVLTLFAISVVTFALFFAGPANPSASMCGTHICPADTAARIDHALGLDRPILEQYADYMKGIFVGRPIQFADMPIECDAPCLGISFRNREAVLNILLRAMPITLSIVLGGFVVYILVGIGIGMISAIRRGTVLDKTAVGFSLTFASMQIYLLGPVLALIFVWNTDLLPRPQYISPAEGIGSWMGGMLLPWLTLGLINSAQYARFTRAQMLETLSEDFVRTARAKGLGRVKVNVKHAFRAAITPLVTVAGLDLGAQLGGVIITETTFSMLGVGRRAVMAVNNSDLPIIMATVLLGAVFIVVANFVVDLIYAVIDPRVRLS